MPNVPRVPCKVHGRRPERGSLLVSMLWVSLFLTVMVTVISSSLWRSAGMTHAIVSKNRATYVAESGLQDALTRLRRNATQTLEDGSFEDSLGPTERQEHYDVELSTSGTGDPKVVLVTVDGTSRQTTQKIEALVRLENVGDYVAATAGTMRIGYGTQLEGKVYGARVIFGTYPDYPTGTPPDPRTFLDTLAHYEGEPIQPSDFRNFVNLRNEPERERTPLSFPAMDDQTLGFYRALAEESDAVIAGGNLEAHIRDVLGGRLSPPSPHPLYFVEGNGNIPADTTFEQQLLIVASGTITVKGNLTKQRRIPRWRDSLLGLLTNRNVVIAAESDPAEAVTVHAFVYAPHGSFKAVGTPRTGALTFQGGFVAKTDPSFDDVFQGTRTYTYDTRLRTVRLSLLPNRAEIVRYRVRQTTRR
ncbi:MAG: hypothetical protein HYZ73_00485 [Elusimicrobia bacterium]|nr:hypothetical protein [Elusimicrobiota bacterium]